MQEKADAQLLREYAEAGNERAFGELVLRHTDLVYSAALRQVGSPDIAKDVAQSVFSDLARKAHPLLKSEGGHDSLIGWLYRSTRFAALNQLRDERRRHARERLAMENLEPAGDENANWDRVGPLLDSAMNELGDTDRQALLLRFFKNYDFRAIGQALGLSDDAAQKRVSRALEKLRAEFARRGVSTSVIALSTSLTANAVCPAPAGLAVTLSSAALAGTTAATTTVVMTTIQKALIAATLAVAAGTGIYQAHKAARWRAEAQTAQQQQAPLLEQVAQLQRERDDTANQVVALRDENARVAGDSAEVLKLRGEIALLRRAQTISQPPGPAIPAPSTASDTQVSAALDLGRQLGEAIVRGEQGALEKLQRLAKEQHASYNTNSTGLNDSQKGDLARLTFAPLRASFDVITPAAANGNPTALKAVGEMLQIPELRGLAVDSVGKLAAAGNQEALQMVLSPADNGFNASTAVSTLSQVAGSGNPQAIAALVAVAKDEQQRPLWALASDGLSKAAELGNQDATDALIHLLNATNNSAIQNLVIAGLKRAAASQNARAASALSAAGVK